MTARNEQEAFWASEFGDEYVQRNQSAALEASNTVAFAHMLCRAHGVGSILELGANIGMNMRALRHVLPDVSLSAVEINKKAHEQLAKLPGVTAHHGSIADFS